MGNLRGIFSNVLPDEYLKKEKKMSVILLKTRCVSFDLIFNGNARVTVTFL
jgi:hypothetical protein